MLDLNQPRTSIIFKASHYIDQIKLGCETYILQVFEERQLTFKKMKDICDEMLLFCQKEFLENFEDIKDILKQIESEIDTLSTFNNKTEPNKCTVCNSKIIISKSIVNKKNKIAYCTNCPKNIYNYLGILERLTDAIWI